MTTPPAKPDKQRRYRAYFVLMNASLAALVYSVLELLVDRLTGFDPEDYMSAPVAVIFYAPLLVLVFLVPFFLICARFMRDEYAEQLWRRTSVVLAYATAIIPLAFYVGEWLLYFALGQPAKAPSYLRWSKTEVEWGNAILYVWLGYMMVFVLIFQFLRWRDSR
ncbi:hypothetical protein [Porphyrobacter sp. YT40]|uniref:hypothetical protein n=1 Tax=Porphyrobacter sp. YT40 TaxID=2547601 RepID=UPI0011451B42|nr:hypothetical protein [Porphyrobacter sp. YT40]QDH34921.1 hypothetical protein E2E27_11645 [Porphyrobacter sp. YT40]